MVANKQARKPVRAAGQRRAGLMFLRALWCAPGNYLSHLSSARCRMRSIIRSPRSVHHDNSQTQHLKLTKPAARCSSTIGESTGRRAFCEPIVLASDLKVFLILRAGGLAWLVMNQGEDKGLLSPTIQGVLGAPGKPQGLDRMAQERPGEIGRWHFWQFRGAFSSDG